MKPYRLPTTIGRGTKRGVTLVEVVIVAGLLIFISVPLLASMLFVLRTQATAADITLTRLQAEQVISQLKADIRNSSSGVYNTVGWPRLSENSYTIQISMLDTVLGRRIRWTFNKSERTLTRNVGVVESDAMASTTTRYPAVFADFVMEEIRHSEFVTPTEASGGGEVEDESSSLQQITAVRIAGRVFHRLAPNHTVWTEIDADGDGTYFSDRIGADLFGRTDAGDDAKWQYLFNSQVAFRNS